MFKKPGRGRRDPEDEAQVWAVEVQPGNDTAFFEPWGSAEYTTRHEAGLALRSGGAHIPRAGRSRHNDG